MTTTPGDLRSGDVIELGDGDDAVTALVLLVSDDGKVILDRCDGTCPVVAEVDQLRSFRVFRPEPAAA